MRVYDLAKKLNISSKELIRHLHELGLSVKSHMSSLDSETANEVFSLVKEEKEKLRKVITMPDTATISDLSKRLDIPVTDLIKGLMKKGLMYPINKQIDEKVLDYVRDNYNVEIRIIGFYEDELFMAEEKEATQKAELTERGPIVTVMGHVDHGKTKLLDAIRKTNVVEGETGGITQHIGASKVKFDGREIVFLDTPGHEAFTAMRARGAKVTDIVVLVVAADDGVMPQTIEAIDHARAGKVPILVALNKIDLPNANPENVKKQLADLGLLPEEWGGDVIFVEVSAKENKGIDDLLEMILLQTEMLELKANKNVSPRGTVLEARLDKKRGPVATLLVQNGTLRAGDIVVVGTIYGKIRAMFDDNGKKISLAGPSTPVEILGLSGVPDSGDPFWGIESEKKAKLICEKRKEIMRRKKEVKARRVSLDDLYTQIKAKEIKELNLILKADVQGSLEVAKSTILKTESDRVKLSIIHAGVGEVNESDVMLAAASNAVIIGFHVGVDPKARKIAEAQRVDLRMYDVIYDLSREIKQAMEGLLEPEYKERLVGVAKVKQTFRISKVGMVAGCLVEEGEVVLGRKSRIIRDGVKIYDGKIKSLRRFKEDVTSVKRGLECGIGFENFNDIRPDDRVEIYELEKVGPKL